MLSRKVFSLHSLLSRAASFKFCSTQAESLEGDANKALKPKFKKVAIVLSGAGAQDGSETTEVVSLMVNLNKMYVDFQCFAPNTNQLHVVNHVTGEVTQETRNVLVESARIARGNVKDITELKADDYQAILVPGGFGAAKNLSDYAVNGGSFSVHEEVTRVLREFHAQKKPIGAMCISPLLLAKVFQEEKPKITLGRVDHPGSEKKYWPYSDAIQVAESLGAQVQQRNSDKFQIDFDNKIVTTPAFMYNGFLKFSTTFDGAESLCKIVEHLVLGQPIHIENFQTSREKRQNSNGDGQKNYQRRQYNNRNQEYNSEEYSGNRRRQFRKTEEEQF